MNLLLFIAIYISFAISAYSMSFAFLQNEYKSTAKEDREYDIFISFIIAVMSFFGVMLVFSNGWEYKKHGFKFW